MGLVTIGLKSVEYAPLAADGGPGTVFEVLGFTSKGTLTFNEDAPAKKLVEAEETNVPLRTLKRAAQKSVTLSLADPDTDALAKIRGGSVATAAGSKTYSEDDAVELIGTLKVTPEEGLTIVYNRVSIFGRFNGGLGAEQELLLVLDVDIEKPTKAGVKVWEAIEEVAV